MRDVTSQPSGGGPLADLTVLDLSLLLPGPFAAQMLADLGADVVKVEPPRGDDTRTMPSELYDVANRNKRGVVWDLKTDADREACLRLAERADVVIEGFRPGVVDRLAVGYDAVHARNPAVVYCSVSGYGQTGPRRVAPGHDVNYLAAGGGLAFSGHWGEPPRRSGIPLGDLASSSYAAVAILAALHERVRTGRGAYLDVAITDAVLAFASVRGGRGGNLDPADQAHLWQTNDVFETADGRLLAVGVVEPVFWERLRAALAGEDGDLLAARFDTEAGRRGGGNDLKARLAAIFLRRPAAEWVDLLDRHDVPASVVASLPEAMATEQAQARGIVTSLQGERHVIFPVLRDGAPMGRLRRLAPRLGEHTDEVVGGPMGAASPDDPD